MIRTRAAILLAGACAVACATMHGESPMTPAVRDALDLPERFVPASSTAAPPTSSGSCRSPLTDPRDGTRLTLARSANGIGDYEVRPLRYGMKEGELLRVDCVTSRGSVIVRR